MLKRPYASRSGSRPVDLILHFRDMYASRRIPVLATALTLGRSSRSGVTIQDPSVSRHHVRLFRSGKTWTVEDLKSKNGTLLNGRAVTRGWVVAGDRIQIGQLVIAVTGDERRPRRPVPRESRLAALAGDPGPVLETLGRWGLEPVFSLLQPLQAAWSRIAVHAGRAGRFLRDALWMTVSSRDGSGGLVDLGFLLLAVALMFRFVQVISGWLGAPVP